MKKRRKKKLAEGSKVVLKSSFEGHDSNILDLKSSPKMRKRIMSQN